MPAGGRPDPSELEAKKGNILSILHPYKGGASFSRASELEAKKIVEE